MGILEKVGIRPQPQPGSPRPVEMPRQPVGSVTVPQEAVLPDGQVDMRRIGKAWQGTANADYRLPDGSKPTGFRWPDEPQR